MIGETNNRIENVRSELIDRIDAVRLELSARIGKQNDKIDAQYKWILGFLISIGVAVVATLIKEYPK